MNQRLQKRIIDLARVMCPYDKNLQSRHVSFLVKSGKICHIGWNKNRTHPFNLNHPYVHKSVGLHAELDVCLKSGKDDLAGYTLVVIRIDKNGKVCNSCPCVGCKSVIQQFNVSHVWYSLAEDVDLRQLF